MKRSDDPRVKCDDCGDYIGVYEPVVIVAGEEPRETSLAAQPQLRTDAAQRYHRACYLEPVRAEAA